MLSALALPDAMARFFGVAWCVCVCVCELQALEMLATMNERAAPAQTGKQVFASSLRSMVSVACLAALLLCSSQPDGRGRFLQVEGGQPSATARSTPASGGPQAAAAASTTVASVVPAAPGSGGTVVALSDGKKAAIQRRFELEQGPVESEFFVSALPSGGNDAPVPRPAAQASNSPAASAVASDPPSAGVGAGAGAGVGVGSASDDGGSAGPGGGGGGQGDAPVAVHASGMVMGNPMDGVTPPKAANAPASVDPSGLPFGAAVSGMMLDGLRAHLRSMGIDPDTVLGGGSAQ